MEKKYTDQNTEHDIQVGETSSISPDEQPAPKMSSIEEDHIEDVPGESPSTHADGPADGRGRGVSWYSTRQPLHGGRDRTGSLRRGSGAGGKRRLGVVVRDGGAALASPDVVAGARW